MVTTVVEVSLWAEAEEDGGEAEMNHHRLTLAILHLRGERLILQLVGSVDKDGDLAFGQEPLLEPQELILPVTEDSSGNLRQIQEDGAGAVQITERVVQMGERDPPAPRALHSRQQGISLQGSGQRAEDDMNPMNACCLRMFSKSACFPPILDGHDVLRIRMVLLPLLHSKAHMKRRAKEND